MQSESFVSQQINEQGLLPLFYSGNSSTCLEIIMALYEAGMRSIEFTNRGELAFENFSQMVRFRDASLPGLLLGIGTIKTGEEANRFINAGADFLVSPVFDSSICDAAYINKVLWIPGCMTPTEIHVAQQAGCNMIKLFPGNLLKPSYLESVLPLFSGLNVMVTGGVEATEQSLREWFNSGASVVGIGGNLVSKQIIAQVNMELLKIKATEILSIVRAIKNR